MWLVQKVENFPKSHRFTIGERLVAHGLDLLTLLVEASYTRQKTNLLEAASRKVNAVRMLLRLAKDLKLISMEAYAFSADERGQPGDGPVIGYGPVIPLSRRGRGYWNLFRQSLC